MQTLRWLSFTALLVVAGIIAPGTAQAAQSYDACAGFIDTLPATVSTQGVWCLRKDLSTAITSGNAITIATNNVTIDCNGFKLGGLSAGDTSQTNGMYGNALNTTVRNCNIRGFMRGVYLQGGGHVVEDNRFDQNLFTGIVILGDNHLIQRNQVFDTGGSVGSGSTWAIDAQADVLDNTVSGVFSDLADADVYGIIMYGHGNQARGNRVRGLVPNGTGVAYGLYAGGYGSRVDSNHVSATSTTNGTAIAGSFDSICINNSAVRFQLAFGCAVSSGNLSSP